jgi:hypothetical protein
LHAKPGEAAVHALVDAVERDSLAGRVKVFIEGNQQPIAERVPENRLSS